MHTISRGERVRAIIFLSVGLLLIAGVCGLLIGLPLLKNTRQYFVRFNESVTGIAKGSDVVYQGVKKGRVKADKIDYEFVQLELELDADLHVTETTLARISSNGILPPYFVELRGSVRGSPELPEGSTIKTDPSMTSTLVQRGMAIADHLEAVLQNLERWTGPDNEGKIVKLIDEAAGAVTTLNETVSTLRPEVERAIRAYADAGEELSKVLRDNQESLHGLLEEGRRTIAELNRFIGSGKLDQVTNEASKTLESIRADVTQASASFTKFLEDTHIEDRLNRVVATLERAEQELSRMSGAVRTEVVDMTRGELGPALKSFREAMTSFQELARVLRDDPGLVIFSRPREEIRIPRPGEK